MSGKIRHGFTFIELMIVVMIMGIVATVALVSLRTGSSRKARELFVRDLNALVYSVRLAALQSNKVHRVYFNFAKSVVLGQKKIPGKDEFNKERFQKLAGTQPESVTIPEQSAFDDFFVERKNEVGSARLKDAWFFITGAGFAQEVVLHVRDESAKSGRKQYSLVLNPFSARFDVHEGFVKP